MSGEVHSSIHSHNAVVESSLPTLKRHDGTSTQKGEHNRLLRRQVPYERFLEEYRKEDLTVKQRAHNLDISARTYNRYLEAYGLPRHQRKIHYKFTDEELRRHMDEGQTYKQMAEELHVRYEAVMRRARKLGLNAVRPPIHYKLSDQALRELHGMNITVIDAAKRTDPQVSPHTIKRGWERLALPLHFRGKRRNTTDEEYKELHAKGHRVSEIANIRHEHYDTAARHCRELELKPNRKEKYNLPEQLLRELHARRLTEKKAAVEAGLPAKAYMVIGRRWKDLELAPHFDATKRKTPDEEYIRLHNMGYNFSEIAKMRHESYSTTKRNCRNLKLLLHTRWQVQQLAEAAQRGGTPTPQSVSVTEAVMLIREHGRTKITDQTAMEAHRLAVENDLPAGEVVRRMRLPMTDSGLIARWHRMGLVPPYDEHRRLRRDSQPDS